MPPFTKTDFIWMNGEMLPWNDAQIHVSAHGLQYGTGVFEGMRSYDTPEGPAIFRLEPHMKRFIASAKEYELELPYSLEELSEASLEVIRQNKLENAYLRPLAFFDTHSWSVSPKGSPVTVVIMAVPGRAYIEGGPEHGVRVTVSSVRRVDASVLPPTVKACGHYTNSVRAVQDAMRRGFEEAILLDSKGFVAEGSGANLFMVKDGKIVTNDVDSSILMGVTRDAVIQIIRDMGIPMEIRQIAKAELDTADELFFSGTAVEVMPIRELDGRALGSSKLGSITGRVQKTFADVVHGKMPQYRSWLTPTGTHATAGA